MNAGTSKPSNFIPIVNAAAIKFDAEHENDKEYSTTAAYCSGDFILRVCMGSQSRLSIGDKTHDRPKQHQPQMFQN
jgi:hypothetical protein